MSKESSKTETSSASTADSTPNIVQNVKSSVRKCNCCLIWFLKISLLILCILLMVFLGKSLYKWFTQGGKSQRTTEEILSLLLLVVGLFSAISVAIAIFFEHLCTLIIILIGLIVHLCLEMYPVFANDDGSWDKLLGDDNQQFISFCVLTGTFFLYIIILYFTR